MKQDLSDRIQASAYMYMGYLLERFLETTKYEAGKLALTISRQRPEWEAYSNEIHDALVMAAEDTIRAGIDVAREAVLMNTPTDGDSMC